MNKFYITTAIPYVNAAPHIGFALEIIQADTLARYHRLLGENVFFLTGTDENSLKNVEAAEKEDLPTQKLCDKYAQKYYHLKQALNLSFDDFLRTTEKRHIIGSQKLWRACKKGDIYKKKYRGFYCLGCEAFYKAKDLVNGLCPEHKKKPGIVEEENYFFKLSRYQKKLEKLIASEQLLIIPETRKNEVLSFIRSGLEDFSISRSVKRAKGWGIDVPGDSSQKIYVWFDALANYITALGYGTGGKLFAKYWPADVHVIGKGIIRFHAVYWPAMLLSAGLALPRSLFVHAYVTVEGQKIGKSLGNVIDPFTLVKKYGTDSIRYYLLAKIPPFVDGDFSLAHFEEVYNADLANGLGNLVQRVAKLAEKTKTNALLTPKPKATEYHRRLKQYKFNECLSWLWGKISAVDKYIDQTRPWKKKGKELAKILKKPIQEIREIGYLLQPFLPETAEKIKRTFSADKIKAPKKSLFPRL